MAKKIRRNNYLSGARTSTLKWPTQSKFNPVNRALPYPARGEEGCRWRAIVTPAGRVMLEPMP